MSTTQTLTTIKKICTFFLMVSFFLPIVRGCSDIEAPVMKPSDNQAKTEPWFKYKNENPKTYYPWKLVFDGQGAKKFPHLLLSYFWPIPFLWFHKRTKTKLKKLSLTVIELFFCVVAAYLILLVISFNGAILYGGYISLISLSIYFIVCFFVMIKILFDLLRKRKDYPQLL